MKLKNLIIAAAAITILSQGTALQAATVIGTYSMEATATLTGGQGLAYNGSSWYYGSGSSWQTSTGTAWQSSTAPTDLNDISAASFLADTSSAGSLNLGFGFDGTRAVNGSGSDLVFFFLWDQNANSANVSINGITRELSFHNVYNSLGQQLVVNGVNWNGTTQQNVLLMAGEIDLSDFGLLAGASVNDPFNINLTANSTTIPMALSLVGALHTGAGTTAVPVPAPFALLFSGLAALGLIARRK